jgi:hypothetical protein
MHMNDIDYHDVAVMCRGFIAYDDTASGKRPGLLIFHEGPRSYQTGEAPAKAKGQQRRGSG